MYINIRRIYYRSIYHWAIEHLYWVYHWNRHTWHGNHGQDLFQFKKPREAPELPNLLKSSQLSVYWIYVHFNVGPINIILIIYCYNDFLLFINPYWNSYGHSCLFHHSYGKSCFVNQRTKWSCSMSQSVEFPEGIVIDILAPSMLFGWINMDIDVP